MKTHNAIIYHCVQCGRVVHAERESGQPQCCGSTMGKAAAETIRESDVTGVETFGGPETVKGRKKPR